MSEGRILPETYGRATALRIPYDVFGKGPKRVVLLSGLGMSRRFWVHQISHLAGKPDEYSALVIENRGSGEVSNRPMQPYTTMALAGDVRRVLDLLDWTADKSVHVVGLSMGGMCALKLCTMIPERIASLCLAGTCAQWRPSKSFLRPASADGRDFLRQELAFAFSLKPAQTAASIIKLSFPRAHLAAADAQFPDHASNYDRYLTWGNLLACTQSKAGLVGQIGAVLTHRVSRSQLRAVGQAVQFCQVVVGAEDRIVDPGCSKLLATEIGCKLRSYADAGHLVPWQHPNEFNKDLVDMITQADAYWKANPPRAANGGRPANGSAAVAPSATAGAAAEADDSAEKA